MTVGEQPHGEQARQHQAQPPDRGVDRVSGDVGVQPKPGRDGERDHVQRRAIQVRAVNGLVERRSDPRPVVEQAARLLVLLVLVPRRPEVSRRRQKQRQ